MRFNLKPQTSYLTLYFALGLISILSYVNNWPIVRLIGAKQEKDFGDAGIILNAADCFKDIGLNVYKVESGNCSYNYGESLIRVLHILGIGKDSIDIIGIVFIALFILAFVECIRSIQPLASFRIQGLAILFFLSPPTMLLLERGNFDSLIFFLLVASVILKTKKRNNISILILVSTVLFKFYTFPVLVYFLFRDHNWKEVEKRNYLLLLLPTALVMQDLYRISQGFSIPNPMWFAFGSSKFPWAAARIFGIDLPRSLQLLAGAVLVIVILMLIYRFEDRLTQLKELKRVCLGANENSKLMTQCMALVFVVSYFAGMSYIYRLVFAIPVFIYLLICQRRANPFMMISIACAIVLSPWFGGLEFLGDLGILWLVPLVVWIYFPKVKILSI